MYRNHFCFTLLCAVLLTFVATSCSKDVSMDWKTTNEMWLDNNARRLASDTRFHTTQSGLQYLVINEGLSTERRPNSTGYVTIHYTGMLIDGHIFDSTDKMPVDFTTDDLIDKLIAAQFDKSQSSQMQVSQLITGMQEGLSKMRVPGEAIFFIPEYLAYGKDGNSSPGFKPYIPPYSTLIFKVELLQCYL